MRQWEYLRLPLHYIAGTRLDDLGRLGWELILYVNGEYLFKRQLAEVIEAQ